MTLDSRAPNPWSETKKKNEKKNPPRPDEPIELNIRPAIALKKEKRHRTGLPHWYRRSGGLRGPYERRDRCVIWYQHPTLDQNTALPAMPHRRLQERQHVIQIGVRTTGGRAVHKPMNLGQDWTNRVVLTCRVTSSLASLCHRWGEDSK